MRARKESSRPLKQRQPHRRRRKKMPRRTPMTIPAIAPPLKPLLLVVDCMPAAVEVEEADGEAL